MCSLSSPSPTHLFLIVALDDCLIQQATIAKIEAPLPNDLKMLRRWLSHPKMGNDFLYGHEAKVWNETYDHDFIAMPRPEGEIERDGLSRLFLDQMVDLWQRGVGRFYKVRGNPAWKHR